MTIILNSRDEVEAECRRLGVQMMTHAQASPWTNVAAWANLACRLRGEPVLFSDRMVMTLYPRMLFPDWMANRFEDWALLCHELVHWRRQRELGLFKWVAKYVFDKEQRFLEEGYAFLEDLRLGRSSQSYIVNVLTHEYGIDTISQADMHAWFNANRREK